MQPYWKIEKLRENFKYIRGHINLIHFKLTKSSRKDLTQMLYTDEKVGLRLPLFLRTLPDVPRE